MADTPFSRTFAKAIGTRLLTVSITALVIGMSGAAALITSDRIAARASAPAQSALQAALPVTTLLLEETSSYTVDASYPGRVEAPQRVALGFEDGGTLADIYVDEGDSVAAGQTLATLDTVRLRTMMAREAARIDALQAGLDLARLTEDRQKTLLEGGHVSSQRHDEARLEVARIEAEIEAARAGLATINSSLDKAVIKAPFAGVIGDRPADAGQRLAPGSPVVELIAGGSSLFRAGVPLARAVALAPGERAEIEIDGRIFPAKVIRIRADMDTATRTRDVILRLESETPLPDAAIGTLNLEVEVAERGAWVPRAALAEGLRGLWTVYFIEEDAGSAIARPEAVEILYSDGDRAFVRGAFAHAETRIIAEGPHRVADGQLVQILEIMDQK